MKITRCRDQAARTLEQFYGELVASDNNVSRSIGEAMLRLLHELHSRPTEHEAWGLTSLHHLCLLAEDRYDTPWFVRVIGSESQYLVEYLLPKNVEPWPSAYVQGQASSPEQAVNMVLVGMGRSGGWSVGNKAAA
jgi:hypothetical protein